MANKNIWLKPFDPNADFIASKVLKLDRRLLHPGHKVPKGVFTERRLRQLYDNRQIAMAEDATTQPQTTVEARRDARVVQNILAPPAAPQDNATGPYALDRYSPAWANIMLDGEKVEGPLRLKDAEQRLAELNEGI